MWRCALWRFRPRLRSGFTTFSRGPRASYSPMLAAPRLRVSVLRGWSFLYSIFMHPKKCGGTRYGASALAYARVSPHFRGNPALRGFRAASPYSPLRGWSFLYSIFKTPKNVAVRAVRPDNCDKTEGTNRTYITRSVRLVRSNRGLYVLLCLIRPVLICRGGLRWRGRPHFHESF